MTTFTQTLPAQLDGSLSLKASPAPLKSHGTLDKYDSFNSTPVIGTEFRDLQLSELLDSVDKDALLRDLAILGEQYSCGLLVPC